MHNVIEAVGITKRFGSGGSTVVALDGVHFWAERSEFVAIMGPSGSGKSTLLSILGGLDLPNEGDVRVNEHDLLRMNETERSVLRRRHIGFVFQSFNLVPVMTATENVALPLLLDGMKRDDAHSRSRDALDAVGLSHRLSHRPGELSGGEQQRVAIARALVTRPAVVLADEPTGNLDLIHRSDVLTIRPLNDSPTETVAVTALVDVLPQLHNLVADKGHFPHLYVPGEEYKVSFVDFDPEADRDRIAAEVRALLAGGYAAFSYSDFDEWKARWRQELSEMLAMVGGMAVLLLLIEAAGLINTMAANLHERRAELATLYAIGATPAQLRRIIRAEAVTIGTAGSILGVAIGVAMMFALLGGAISEGIELQFSPWTIVGGLLAGPAVASVAASMLAGRYEPFAFSYDRK